MRAILDSARLDVYLSLFVNRSEHEKIRFKPLETKLVDGRGFDLNKTLVFSYDRSLRDSRIILEPFGLNNFGDVSKIRLSLDPWNYDYLDSRVSPLLVCTDIKKGSHLRVNVHYKG